MKSVGQMITESVCGEITLYVGKKTKHPSGRKVQITSGAEWVRGRLSNFWYWREILPDGRLSKTEEHGYGWE